MSLSALLFCESYPCVALIHHSCAALINCSCITFIYHPCVAPIHCSCVAFIKHSAGTLIHCLCVTLILRSCISHAVWSLLDLFFPLTCTKSQTSQPDWSATTRTTARADVHKAHCWLTRLFVNLVHIAWMHTFISLYFSHSKRFAHILKFAHKQGILWSYENIGWNCTVRGRSSNVPNIWTVLEGAGKSLAKIDVSSRLPIAKINALAPSPGSYAYPYLYPHSHQISK